MTRFKDWLDLSDILPSAVSVKQNVFSVLGYLAYDAVQEVSGCVLSAVCCHGDVL